MPLTKLDSKVINIELDEIQFKLSRLDDGQYYDVWENTLSIADDYLFYLRLYRDSKLNLALFYVLLEKLCGSSGKSFDDWKGSFYFPFSLEVIKGEHKFNYLLNIYAHRSSLYFGIRKVLQPKDDTYDRRGIHQPLPEEFSREEINHFISYLYGYIEGYSEALPYIYKQDFFRCCV